MVPRVRGIRRGAVVSDRLERDAAVRVSMAEVDDCSGVKPPKFSKPVMHRSDLNLGQHQA
jgi:hypothetical protein